MKFGISMFPTDYAIQPAELGKAAEDLGFESLWFPEHTHIPTSRKSAWPGGAELPKEYSHTIDPFVAIGAIAAVTKTIKIATGICLVIERDPITLAKEVASADHVSGGRFIFGIGGGWNLEEMENHGTKPTLRWKILRERVLAMQQIWTNDEAEYHGEFVNFDPIWSWPKPVQKPYPPVVVGGNGPRTLQRVIEFGDEWMPTRVRDLGEFKSRIDELQSMAKAAGRGRIPVGMFGASGHKEYIDELAAAGCDRAVLGLRPAPAEEAISQLKHYAEFVKSYEG